MGVQANASRKLAGSVFQHPVSVSKPVEMEEFLSLKNVTITLVFQKTDALKIVSLNLAINVREFLQYVHLNVGMQSLLSLSVTMGI